jgi:hypothetical protein
MRPSRHQPDAGIPPPELLEFLGFLLCQPAPCPSSSWTRCTANSASSLWMNTRFLSMVVCFRCVGELLRGCYAKAMPQAAQSEGGASQRVAVGAPGDRHGCGRCQPYEVRRAKHSRLDQP